MLDENLDDLPLKRRRARRSDFKSALGTVMCGLALAYLTTAAVVLLVSG
jgi:hypothetical protein